MDWHLKKYGKAVSSYSPRLARHSRDYLGTAEQIFSNTEVGCIIISRRGKALGVH